MAERLWKYNYKIKVIWAKRICQQIRNGYYHCLLSKEAVFVLSDWDHHLSPFSFSPCLATIKENLISRNKHNLLFHFYKQGYGKCCLLPFLILHIITENLVICRANTEIMKAKMGGGLHPLHTTLVDFKVKLYESFHLLQPLQFCCCPSDGAAFTTIRIQL